MIAPQWEPCSFPEHLDEVRRTHSDLMRLMGGHLHQSTISESTWLHLTAVSDLLDHYSRLHEDGVLVRLVEPPSLPGVETYLAHSPDI